MAADPLPAAAEICGDFGHSDRSTREAQLLIALKEPPPRPPRCCRCATCRRRLGRFEVAVLVLAGGSLQVFCEGHCPVPVDSRHLAWNRCWGCGRPALLGLDVHHAPYCSAHCSRRALASAAAKWRQRPDAWTARDERKLLRRVEDDSSGA